MDINQFNKASSCIENIKTLSNALGIESNVWDKSDDDIRNYELILQTSLPTFILLCRESITEIVQDRLIEELKAFRNL